jgi:hypothetical protein
LQPDLHSHQTGTKGIQLLVEIDHTLWILGQGITAKDALSAVHAILGDVLSASACNASASQALARVSETRNAPWRYPNCAASPQAMRPPGWQPRFSPPRTGCTSSWALDTLR